MTRKISALTARTQLGQIMSRAVDHNERSLVEVTDFVKTLAPPPDWLEKSWDSAKRHGLDKLTMEDIDAGIAAHRHEKRARKVKPARAR